MSYCAFLLQTIMNVKTDHAIGMPSVEIYLGHSHVTVTLDIPEMALLVKVEPYVYINAFENY